MADGTPNGSTTIIERRGGSAGTILIGLALLIAVIVGGAYLYNRSQNENARADAVTSAAKDVGDSAQKVGDSAQKAVDKATN